MIYRSGDVISDGQTGKRVPADFTDWHSDMTMDQIPGEPCAPIVVPRAQDGPSNITTWPPNGMTQVRRHPNRRWHPTKRALRGRG